MHQQQIKQREQDVALGEVPLHERLAQAAKAQGLPPPDGRHFLSPVQQAALRRPNARRPKGLQVFGERDQSAPRTAAGFCDAERGSHFLKNSREHVSCALPKE